MKRPLATNGPSDWQAALQDFAAFCVLKFESLEDAWRTSEGNLSVSRHLVTEKNGIIADLSRERDDLKRRLRRLKRESSQKRKPAKKKAAKKRARRRR